MGSFRWKEGLWLVGVLLVGTWGQTELLGGSVVTQFDVDVEAALALDVRDMYENLEQDDFGNAQAVYSLGRNTGDPEVTLLELSNQGVEGWYDGEPTFTSILYGLSGAATSPRMETGASFLRDGHARYAHEFVEGTLADLNSGTVAAEAVRALHVWVRATHELWTSVARCAQQDVDGAQHALDKFVALWVGAGQPNGGMPQYERSVGLYALAQESATWFDTMDHSEAPVNTKLKQLYRDARTWLAMTNACDTDEDTLELLWHTAHMSVSRMVVPLLQQFKKALQENDMLRIQLYSLAVVPLTAACQTSTFRYLKGELLDRSYDPKNYRNIVHALHQTYTCLGVTCADVGSRHSNDKDDCEAVVYSSKDDTDTDDKIKPLAMAGYTPTTDVSQQSRIDLDVYQMKILAVAESYDMAYLLYRFGQNSVKNVEKFEYRTLQNMATSDTRKHVTPWFAMHESYFGDPNYADTAVLNALLEGSSETSKTSPWRNGAQRAQVIHLTLVHQTVPMAAASELQQAYDKCEHNRNEPDQAVHDWDEAAAYLIGSIEGPQEGGADVKDGQLTWNVANQVCTLFGTCQTDGVSSLNGELEDLLYAGVGQLKAGDCVGLKKTMHRINHVRMIPTMQMVMKYAIQNEDHSAASPSDDLAAGETLALSILPVVQHYDPPAAQTLARNMLIDPDYAPVYNGPATVGSTFATTLDEFGVRCSLAGNFGDVNACPSSDANDIANIFFTKTTTILLTLTAFLAWRL